jgi:hypothetical protein
MSYALLLPIAAQAQTASTNYSVNASGATNAGGISDWIDCTSGTEITLGDDAEASFSWPFNFTFYDDAYTTSNSISVVSNGFLRLDGTGTTSYTTAQSYDLTATSTGLGQIVALAVQDCNTNDSNSHVYYLTTGTAPNRILTVEYVDLEITYNANKYADVQVSFYETSNNVVIRFGDDDVTSSSAEMGLHSGVASFFSDFGDIDTATNNTYVEYTPGTSSALSIINDHASNNTAESAPMTIDELEATIVSNLTSENITEYRKLINGESGIANLAALQTVINTANINIIDNFASNNTAVSGFMSLKQLSVTEVNNLIPHLLAQYRTAINTETEIADLPALQTVIDNTNSSAANNNNFANAFEITKNDYTVDLSNVGFDTETGEAANCQTANTMWFYIEPDTDGSVTFQAGGIDCVTSLWSGTELASLSSVVACQDSDNYAYNSNNLGESFKPTLTAGTRYYFRVEPYSTAGTVHINISGTSILSSWDGSEWSTGEPPTETQDIIVESDLNLPEDIECEDLTITTGNMVTVENGETLTVNGNVFVEAGAELVNTGNISITGTANEVTTMTLSTNLYSYFSSPINGAAMTGLGTPQSIFHFIEATDTWHYYDPSNLAAEGNFSNALGYALRYTSPTAVTLKGVLNDGNYSTTVTNNGAYDSGGWNLVGNPYPSAIDADQFLDDNSSVINHTMYLWDNSDYATHNGTFGVNPTGNATPTGRVGVGQGFFVRKTSSGSASVNFTNSMRLDNGQFYRKSEAQMIRLRLENETWSNAFEIHFNDDASYAYEDKWDAEKLKGNPDIAFYSVWEDKDLILQSIPATSQNTQIPFGYDVSKTGNYRIVLENVQHLPEGSKLELIDHNSAMTHDISKGAIVEFMLEEGSHRDRFALRLSNDQNDDASIAEQLSAYISNGTLQIHNMSNIEVNTVSMYDMTGRVIHQQKGAAAWDVETLPTGIYMIQMQTESGDVNHKLYIE